MRVELLFSARLHHVFCMLQNVVTGIIASIPQTKATNASMESEPYVWGTKNPEVNRQNKHKN